MQRIRLLAFYVNYNSSFYFYLNYDSGTYFYYYFYVNCHLSLHLFTLIIIRRTADVILQITRAIYLAPLPYMSRSNFRYRLHDRQLSTMDRVY